MKRFISLAGLLGVVLFVITSIIGGLQIEEYSFVSKFISESYATGVPNARYLRHSFIISGLLLTIFGFLTPVILKSKKRANICFYLFAVFYGLGTVVTSLYPCDFGCPSDLNVSFSQIVHNASGFLTYAIVPITLIIIGVSSQKSEAKLNFSRGSIICGIIALIFVLLLFNNPEGSFIGLIQRIIEGSILLWVLITAFIVNRS